jgi:hypothetical protein
MQFFSDFGATLEQRWRDKNYDESIFPAMAEEALVAADPLGSIDPWDILRDLHTSAELPGQQENDFSDLPLTVYRSARFFIEVYYWMDGTTSLHQHGFSGAFQVFLGSSLHSQYAFENERKINPHFSVGEVKLKDVQLLERGAIRRILPGRPFIHSLFHLDRPSATITVRTYNDPASQPQFDYLTPHIAINPFFKEPSIMKKMQSAMLLLRTEHPRADELIGELLTVSDFQTSFAVLKEVYKFLHGNAPRLKPNQDGHNSGAERFLRYLEVARGRHGELVSFLPPVLEEFERKSKLIERRRFVMGREHRFFLALLLNVPDKSRILELIGQRFPAREPVETVCEWVQELAGIKMSPSKADDGNGKGGFSSVQMFVLRRILEGFSMEESKVALEQEYRTDYEQSLREEVEALLHFLQNSILKSLLFEPSHASRGEVSTQHQVAR